MVFGPIEDMGRLKRQSAGVFLELTRRNWVHILKVEDNGRVLECLLTELRKRETPFRQVGDVVFWKGDEVFWVDYLLRFQYCNAEISKAKSGEEAFREVEAMTDELVRSSGIRMLAHHTDDIGRRARLLADAHEMFAGLMNKVMEN